ncbi:hypothetical protein [Streptomyces sp. NL15-2K]|uniref:hypothetical protein n=1 Tax=Streptomyces sp. NL15-2K TaxID=376149 RepID=UPI000F5775AB|nr:MULTISPECIES: hypothetical protein [Actinomycetes]WKX15180.1 hypothetical protein Q4V64_49875 [Kutzneria buriramensis]
MAMIVAVGRGDLTINEPLDLLHSGAAGHRLRDDGRVVSVLLAMTAYGPRKRPANASVAGRPAAPLGNAGLRTTRPP